MKKMIQKGFTLIELMIVIAIIGILAALAMPAYQDYIARTQATEALKVTSGLQTDVTTYYADKGTFAGVTNSTSAPGIVSILSTIKGKYFDAVSITEENDSKVTMEITFARGANSKPNPQTMKLTGYGNSVNGQVIGWRCYGFDKPQRLPGSCQEIPNGVTP